MRLRVSVSWTLGSLESYCAEFKSEVFFSWFWKESKYISSQPDFLFK